MRVILIEATPWIADTGAAVDVRLAGGGVRPYTHRGFNDWRSGVASEPKFASGFGFGQEGFTGGAVPSTGAIRFFPSDPALLSKLADDYLWIGAPITIRSGDDELAPGTWVMEMSGTVAAISVAGGALTIVAADLGRKLADPVAKGRFAGTGGIEGEPEAEGRPKRRSFGKVHNVEGRLLNKAANVYEFGDPARPLSSFDVVRDKGREGPIAVLAWQGSIVATYDALVASAPAEGGAVVAPSIACVKWWTRPSGPLTADISGELHGGSPTGAYVSRPAEIAERIVAGSGVGFTAGTVADAVTARNMVSGLHVGDDSETIAEALDRLLIGVSLLWMLEPAGSISLRPISFANPVETITVDTVERGDSFRPIKSLKVGYKRNHRRHSAGEISVAVLASDVSGLKAGAFAETLSQLNSAEGTKLGGISTGATRTFPPSATAPAGAVSGDEWPDTSGANTILRRLEGATWVAVSTIGAVPGENVRRTNGTLYAKHEITNEDVALSSTGQLTSPDAAGNPVNRGSVTAPGLGVKALGFRDKALAEHIARADGGAGVTNDLLFNDLQRFNQIVPGNGKPAPNAGTTLRLTPLNSEVTIEGNRVTATVAGHSSNSTRGVVSTLSQLGSARMEFRVPHGIWAHAFLSTDNSSAGDRAGIIAGWAFFNGDFYRWNSDTNGFELVGAHTGSLNDAWVVEYLGHKTRISVNNLPGQTYEYGETPELRVYLRIMIFSLHTIEDIQFGALTDLSRSRLFNTNGRASDPTFLYTAGVVGIRGTNDVALSATDAGDGTATISIPQHERRFPGVSAQQVRTYNAGSIPGLTLDVDYFVYTVDPELTGGTVTYFATTNSDVLAEIISRVFVGKIRTPPTGGTTTGDGGTVTGGGGGGDILV